MNKLYIQSYGCAMNFSDSEIVASILEKEGYTLTNELSDSDIVLINTCSIREKAEETIRNRLKNNNSFKYEIKNIIRQINNLKNIKIEYLEIRNKKNLSKKYNRNNFKIFLSYYNKNIRLIDNY